MLVLESFSKVKEIDFGISPKLKILLLNKLNLRRIICNDIRMSLRVFFFLLLRSRIFSTSNNYVSMIVKWKIGETFILLQMA